jgi:hypothetical protein
VPEAQREGRARSGERAAVVSAYLHQAGLIEEPRWYWRFRWSPICGTGRCRAGWNRRRIKKRLTSCDRRTRVGRGDHAIPPLLSRLGLRAGEAARLRLVSVGHQTNLRSTSARPGAAALTAASCLRRFDSVEAPIRRVRGGDPVHRAKTLHAYGFDVGRVAAMTGLERLRGFVRFETIR